MFFFYKYKKMYNILKTRLKRAGVDLFTKKKKMCVSVCSGILVNISWDTHSHMLNAYTARERERHDWNTYIVTYTHMCVYIKL